VAGGEWWGISKRPAFARVAATGLGGTVALQPREDGGWKNLAEFDRRWTPMNADGGRNLAAKERKDRKRKPRKRGEIWPQKSTGNTKMESGRRIRSRGGRGMMEYWSGGVEGGEIGSAG
jgi:hypothetical protein